MTVTFAFPLLATFKALKRNADLKPWVMYWSVVSMYTVIESYLYFLVRFVPFYGLMKVYFAIWLILPQTKGAEYLYYKHVEPFFEANEAKIDEFIDTYSPGRGYLVSLLVTKRSAVSADPLASTQPSTTYNNRSLLDGFVDSFSTNGEAYRGRDLLQVGTTLLKSTGVSFFSDNRGTGLPHSTPVKKSPHHSTTPSPDLSVQEPLDYDMVQKEEINNILETSQVSGNHTTPPPPVARSDSSWGNWWYGKPKNA